MGKSFIIRMYSKEQVLNGKRLNYALLVFSKALINEVNIKIIYDDMKNLLEKHNYRVVTSAGSLSSSHFIYLSLTSKQRTPHAHYSQTYPPPALSQPHTPHHKDTSDPLPA